MSGEQNDNITVSEMTAIFDENIEYIIEEWLKRAYLSPNDVPFYPEVINNVRMSIRFLQAHLRRPEWSHLEKLTKKIVKERIQAKVNLEKFVGNINIGREIVHGVIIQSSMSKEKQLDLIIKSNQFFDHYTQQAVSSYSQLKESIIDDKNKFIKEMHGDRLTILGQIAASFAHEFRNPLASIHGFISLLERQVPENEKTSYYFSIVNREMKSLEEKVSQFLYLSQMKGLDDQMEMVDLSKVLGETVEFMYPRFLIEKINVRTTISEELRVFGVEEQVKQVFLNIINNAVEELSLRDGVRIIDIDAGAADGAIQVSISNTGPVIPAHILDNIFEPFISTKELGTGLGLSVCKQIVEKHNGNIAVESNTEKTTFKIEFPPF